MAAPARYAMATPSPVATGGLVVRPYTCPAPPVASTVTMATLSVSPPSARLSVSAPTQRPSTVSRSMTNSFS